MYFQNHQNKQISKKNEQKHRKHQGKKAYTIPHSSIVNHQNVYTMPNSSIDNDKDELSWLVKRQSSATERKKGLCSFKKYPNKNDRSNVKFAL